MREEYLFVYGTLRRDAPPTEYHTRIRQFCAYVTTGEMQGQLYDLGDYPGAVESDNPDDTVQGKVYRLLDADAVLPTLDVYEGCDPNSPVPHEYRRKQLSIRTTSGETIIAWVYVYQYDVLPRTRILGGNYLTVTCPKTL
jgi:gamma-glutamylcyclotransferase (GGCT)/AIG2-like uncharacterized protein YtfP